MIPGPVLDRIYRKADASRWEVPRERLAQALDASAARTLGDRAKDATALEAYLDRLHLSDLAVSCACAAGHDAAWEYVVRELRPVLYRAADALDRAGGARDLADGLYADLYGLDERGRERSSLLRYYHGRSSLATWLRAVLAQRYVDRIRETRRNDPLPEEELPAPAAQAGDPERPRWVALVTAALDRSLRVLDARDRLRLASYYADGLTLAEVGRMLGEHEATVSRHLARVRRILRSEIEGDLAAAGLGPSEIAQCLASVAADSGSLDLGRAIAQGEEGGVVQGMRRRT